MVFLSIIRAILIFLIFVLICHCPQQKYLVSAATKNNFMDHANVSTLLHLIQLQANIFLLHMCNQMHVSLPPGCRETSHLSCHSLPTLVGIMASSSSPTFASKSLQYSSIFMMKLKKQPALVCPIDSIGASARPMTVFSGFYESPGPPLSGNAHGIVPPHRNNHWNGHQSGYIIHRCFVCCRPGGRWGNTEQVVAQWQRPVASGVALDMRIGQCRMYHFNASPWPSKWPATEGHLFVAATYLAWHNCS